MKRTALKRQTPLARGTTPLRRTRLESSTPIDHGRGKLTRSGKLKQRSKKRVVEDRQRADAKVLVLERARGMCLAYASYKQGSIDRGRFTDAERAWFDRAWRDCGIYAEHVHEPLTRARGGSITDPENMIPVCGRCHRKIHDYPRLSEAIGLLKRS